MHPDDPFRGRDPLAPDAPTRRAGVSRRDVLKGLAASALILRGRPVRAQEDAYPVKPIRILQGFAAGGPTDLIARLVADALRSQLGQPVIVETKVGANGTIAAAQVAAASPDGYTLGLFPFNHALAPAFMKSIPYDTVNDFTPIGQIADYPFVLVVHPAQGARSFDEFIRAAKANPNKMSIATAGLGSGPHLGAARLAHLVGTSFHYIPYNGAAQSHLSILRGEVDATLLSAPLAVPDIAAGKLRGLASTGAVRWRDLPDLPTVQELGFKDFELVVWMALMGPKALPAPVARKLEAATQATLGSEEVQNRIRRTGLNVAALDARAFRAKLETDVKRWAEVARSLGIQPE